MLVYTINILLLIVFYLIFNLNNSKKTAKLLFIYVATIQWILLSGLRHISVGEDTYGYKIYRFDLTIYKTWDELFYNLFNYIGKDPLYPLFEKFIQIFTLDYQFFLLAIAILFHGLMGVWIYRNSSNVLVSFIIYSVLFYSFFSVTGHRQTIASALVIFIGYELIKRRKLIPFLLVILIAAYFHKTALIFLPFYFIANKTITLQYILFIIILVVIVVLNKEVVALYLQSISGYTQYEFLQGSGSISFSLFYVLIGLLGMFKRKTIILTNPNITYVFNAYFIGLLLLPLMFLHPAAMRLVQYFSIFIMLMIPDIIKSFDIWLQKIVYIFIPVVLLAFLYKTNPTYLFFWQ